LEAGYSVGEEDLNEKSCDRDLPQGDLVAAQTYQEMRR
jgi:hypothetical protein